MEDQPCESTTVGRSGSPAVAGLSIFTTNPFAGAAICIQSFLCSPVRGFHSFLLLHQKKRLQQIKHQVSSEGQSANKALQPGKTCWAEEAGSTWTSSGFAPWSQSYPEDQPPDIGAARFELELCYLMPQVHDHQLFHDSQVTIASRNFPYVHC